jgi:uncharacterized protein
LIIALDEIRDRTLALHRSEPFEHFPVLAELHENGEAVFVRPLDIEATVRRLDEMVMVEGSVNTVVRLQCCRCLQDFECPLSVDFALTYVRQMPVVEDPDAEEIELTADDLGLISFEGDEIDLVDGIQEQVIMALPFKPLCREGCRGLCPQCGADLNLGDCACSEPPVLEGKFSILKNFKVEKKNK